MTDVVESQGWKGVGKTEIVEQDDTVYLLRCWAKSKETGETYFTDHKIPKPYVTNLLGLLKEYATPRTEYGPHWMWRKIVLYYALHLKEQMDADMMVSFFNGSRFRSKYYFPLYYYPMKILEELGHIYYGEKSWMWLG
jgi:hypothetical protein